MNKVSFDEAMPSLIASVVGVAGDKFAEAGKILRDSSGLLAFIADSRAESEAQREELCRVVTEALGDYARKDNPVRFRGDGGADALLSDVSALPVQIGDQFYSLIDRRIVGSGWLEAPAGHKPEPPRIVFATLKGGVGRSTALAVCAADLAQANQNVLVVDLDLEAPGLGHLLLDDGYVPEFGVIDYLVENGIGGVEAADLHRYVGQSALTSFYGGRVEVLPALGSRSSANPENVLPKLARAMIEDFVEGEPVSVSRQISDMISKATVGGQYDVVLIDSRAGLAELAAPAVLGLGATVLLFGTAQKQTIEGYRSLFAALQLLAQRDRFLGKDPEWRAMLRPVYAKASIGNDEAERFFIDEMFELYSAHIYDAEEGGGVTDDLLRFVRDDKNAPHWPLIVPFNAAFVDFDPSRSHGHLSQQFYETTYRPFLSEIHSILKSARTG